MTCNLWHPMHLRHPVPKSWIFWLCFGALESHGCRKAIILCETRFVSVCCWCACVYKHVQPHVIWTLLHVSALSHVTCHGILLRVKRHIPHNLNQTGQTIYHSFYCYGNAWKQSWRWCRKSPQTLTEWPHRDSDRHTSKRDLDSDIQGGLGVSRLRGSRNKANLSRNAHRLSGLMMIANAMTSKWALISEISST